MANKKIVCLGSGSLYFKRAIADLLVSDDLSGSELVLFDIDQEKSAIMAAMGERLARVAGTGCSVRSAATLADAVDGADYALSSIGGSGAGITPRVYMSYYHNADIRIAARYGIQQIIADTCGPGAMMMAFRSVPAYMAICREMEKRCPGAILFNHSNPMAVLCRAMHKYTGLNVVGVCHGVQAGIKQAATVLELPPGALDCLWIGTNHYYWLTRVAHLGRDLYPELRRRLAVAAVPERERLSARLSDIYGFRILYAPDDHIVEFYPFLAQVKGGVDGLPENLAREAREHFPTGETPPPGTAPSTQTREAFFGEYRELVEQTSLPERQSDPLTGEGIAAVIGAIATGRRQVCIANIPNRGCIPNLPSTAEVEVEAVTDSCGVRGLHMGEAPLHLRGILEKRFVWHELVADAAVKGERNLALQALMVDEMAILPDRAEAMLDELLEASRDLLPQFFS